MVTASADGAVLFNTAGFTPGAELTVTVHDLNDATVDVIKTLGTLPDLPDTSGITVSSRESDLITISGGVQGFTYTLNQGDNTVDGTLAEDGNVEFNIEGFTTEDDALYYATLQTIALEMLLLKESTIH